MQEIKKATQYFTMGEKMLFLGSVFFVLLSFVLFDGQNYLTLFASLVGVTSLIFNAKGNPIGQVLMVLFSLLYGIISYSFAYYGEMITYIGMTMPMAIFALVMWLKHPFKGNRSEVKVHKISLTEWGVMSVVACIVTGVFYFVLKFFNTAHLILSTVSITTSFVAVYLTSRRSAYYALAYAMNDMVLIALWMLAARENLSYISVVVCFCAFLVNDVYGFIAWKKMELRQNVLTEKRSA